MIKFEMIVPRTIFSALFITPETKKKPQIIVQPNASQKIFFLFSITRLTGCLYINIEQYQFSTQYRALFFLLVRYDLLT